MLWSIAFLVSLTIGTWGIVGGWWFGLPVGGEIREDVYEDNKRHWRDFFVAVPHPDLVEVPFVADDSVHFRVREKFAVLTGFERSTFWDSKDPSDIAPQNLSKQAQTKQDFAKQDFGKGSVRAVPQVLAYVTRLPSSPMMFAKSLGYCLAVTVDSENRCVSWPDVNVGGRQTLSFANLPSIGLPVLRTLQRVPQTPYSIAMSDDLGGISAITLSGASDPQTWWAGTGLGKIFKVTGLSGDSLEITRSDSPFGTPIRLLAFASRDRGWVWSANSVAQTSNGGATWHNLSERWLPAPWVFAAFMFSAFAFERAARARQEMHKPPAVKRIAEHGVSDNPIGLDDADALGLRPIAASMARFLRNTETKPTVAIGVVGPWGSGKTSLMNLVRQELAARDVRTVWFNAWHNQKEENLLAALLASIRTQAVPPFWTFSGFEHRGRVAWKRLGADLNATIALLICVVVGLVLLFYNAETVANVLTQLWTKVASLIGAMSPAKDTLPPDALKSIGLSTGGITAIVFAAIKLWDLFKPLKSIPAELLSTLNGDSSAKDLNQQLSFRYRFAAEFAVFCEVLRRPPHPGLVIFVDDLDRCGPKQTVDILEAINFVTSIGPCFVVLGLDESKVKAAIADSYKDMTLRLDAGDPARMAALTPAQLQQQRLADLSLFATRYLEKLIHLVVPVPKSRKDSVELLLGVKAGEPARAVPRWRKPVQTAMSILGTTLVVGFLMLAAGLGIEVVTNKLPNLVVSPGATTSAQTSSEAGKSSQGADALQKDGGSAPVVPPPASADELASAGLMSPGIFQSIPAFAIVGVFAFVVVALCFQFLPRLQIEPVVSDGPDFVGALQIASEGISRTRETPRAVKRFVNRLRFMAMRLRDIPSDTPAGPFQLREADLVAMAVIEDLNKDCLGETMANLRIRQAASPQQSQEDGTSDIVTLLTQFEARFGGTPYDGQRSMQIYRMLSGLVGEGGEGAPTDSRAS